MQGGASTSGGPYRRGEASRSPARVQPGQPARYPVAMDGSMPSAPPGPPIQPGIQVKNPYMDTAPVIDEGPVVVPNQAEVIGGETIAAVDPASAEWAILQSTDRRLGARMDIHTHTHVHTTVGSARG